MSETEDYAEVATPEAHHTSHEDGGSDEISVEGLAGELTADQKSAWAKVSGKPTTFDPSAHKTSHQGGGDDEINVADLSGELADPQKSNFLKLSDTPASYSGQAGKFPKVKTAEDGLEFGAAGGWDYIKVSHTLPSGTNGGTFSAGAWRTRPINTEDTDTGNHCSISSNQITLAAGTYECFICLPAQGVGVHKALLRNITDSENTLIGQNTRTATASGVCTYSIVVGRFIITSSKTFEIWHRCGGTVADTGLGYACGFGVDEVYTVAEFRKVA